KHMYWTRGKDQPPTTNTAFYQAAPSAEVEMTSYALMSYLHFSPREAEKIALWLSRQRNPLGGFASTQDTVVALDALSQFATSGYFHHPANLKVEVILKSTAAPSSAKFYVFKGETKTRFLLQRAPIPVLPSTMHIFTNGTGCALVQANVRYNKPVRADKTHFVLKLFVRPYQHDQDRCDHRTLYIKIKSRTGHSVSKGMGLITLRMVTSWSPLPSSLAQLENMSPKLGIKRVDYVEEEGLLHLYLDELSRKAKMYPVDVVQDQDLRVARPKAADVRVVEYYETVVTTYKRYGIKTTCGSEAKKPVPAIKDTDQKTLSTSACPACIKKWKIPNNFRSDVCSASAVYKAVAGRKGARPIKINKDLRPKEVVRLRKFVLYKLPSGCDCWLFSKVGGRKQVIIVTKKKVSGKTLILDRNSIIIKSNRRVEKEVRAAQKTCPLLKEE
ncbi:alpha-2-macroglobulin-like protein, partial [Plakobranchus ocellatus]